MLRVLPFVLLIALALLPVQRADASYSYYDPSPNGVTLLVATPVFSLQAQADPGSSFICTLTFQGQSVVMPYDAQQQGCLYTWPTPLAPGAYTAQIGVASSDAAPLDETLNFSIAPGALTALPFESLQSIETENVVNYVRGQLGLPKVGFDASLQAASQDHAQYFVDNAGLYSGSVSMHSEPSTTAQDYTGAEPEDRDAAFSAVAGGNEVMVTGDPSGPYGLQGLFDTTFHRFGLLDPTVTALGAGFAQTPVTAQDGQSAYVVDMDTGFGAPVPLTADLPWNGETGVPIAFLGEEPDPLAGIAPAAQTQELPESGYPISVTFDPTQVQSVQVGQATLRQGSQAVPIFLVDSQTYSDKNPVYSGEDMGTSVALFPQAPLHYATAYTASVSGTLTLQSGTSEPFVETWTFTTVAAPKVTGVFQDGGQVYVVGSNLSQAYVSEYWFDSGNPNLGQMSYQDDGEIVMPATGPLTRVEITDGATDKVLGTYKVSPAPFSDAGQSASSRYYVDADQAAGLVQGFADGRFEPDGDVTQAQAVAMVYRAMGSPSAAGAAVVPGVPAFAQTAVDWAFAQGVVTAQDGFSAPEPATRAQLVAWLWRAFGLPADAAAPTFSDAASIPPALQGYVSAAAADGVVQGFPDGTFQPQAAVERGAFAVWLWRLHSALIPPQQLF